MKLLRLQWLLQHGQEAFHGGGLGAAGAVDDADGAVVHLIFEVERNERPGLDLLFNCGLRHDRYAGVNLHRTLDGFDIIKLHDGANLHARGAENLVDRLARRHVRLKGDELAAVQLFEINFFLVRQAVAR